MMSWSPSCEYQAIRSLRAVCRFAALILILSAVPESSLAQSTMRCGVHLVGKGALRDEVLARCGRPYSTYRDYWLYRKRNVVYRVYFNDRGEVRRLKTEIRF